MTSHRIRPLALLLSLAPTAACYATHDPLIITGDSGSEGSDSGSTAPTTTVGDPTTASDTSADTSATTMSTSATDDTGPTDTGDSTADGSTTDTGPICGDGMVEGDEVCDDGVNDGSYGGCLADCTDLGPHCGDGIEQGDEVCDDGDEVNGDGCNVDCIVSGSEIWTQTFDGAAHESDNIYSVAVGPEDWIVAAGSEGLTASTRRAWTRRYTSDGDTEWTVTYAGATGQITQADAVAIDGDGGIYIAGRYDGQLEATNGFARKYDDQSALEYTHLFNGGSDENDSYHGIAVSEDGYAVVAGRETRTDLAQGINITVRRLGQDGTEFWTRTQATAQSDIANAVAVHTDGTIVVVGVSNSDAWIRKYDQDGGTLWTRTFDNGGYDSATSVAIDSSGLISVVATITDGDGTSIWIRQYDADGATTWTDSYGTTNDAFVLGDSGEGVAVDSEANVIVAGAVVSDDSASLLASIRKYSSDGDELWTQQWHVEAPLTSALTYPFSVAVDSLDNIVIGGSEVLDNDAYDAWIRKLAP